MAFIVSMRVLCVYKRENNEFCLVLVSGINQLVLECLELLKYVWRIGLACRLCDSLSVSVYFCILNVE